MLTKKIRNIKAECLKKNKFFTKKEFTRVLDELRPYYEMDNEEIDELFDMKAEKQLISKQDVESILDTILEIEYLEFSIGGSQNLGYSMRSSDYLNNKSSSMFIDKYLPHNSFNKERLSIWDANCNDPVDNLNEEDQKERYISGTGSLGVLLSLIESTCSIQDSNTNQESLNKELKQKLADTLKDLGKELERAKLQKDFLCALENENEALYLKIEELETKVNLNADIQTNLAEKNKEIVRLERKVREKEDEKEKGLKELRNLENEHQVLRKYYKEIQGFLQDAKSGLSTSNNNGAQGFTTSGNFEQIELLNIELKTVRAKNADLEKEKEGFQKIIDELKHQLANVKEFNDTLKLEKNDLKSRLEELEKELYALQSHNAVKTSILMQSFRAESLTRESLPRFIGDVFEDKTNFYGGLETCLAEKYNEMVEMERIIREMEERTEQALKQLNNNHEENQNLLRSTIEMQKQGISNIMGQLKVQCSSVKELSESMKLKRNDLQRSEDMFGQEPQVLVNNFAIRKSSLRRSLTELLLRKSLSESIFSHRSNTVPVQAALKGPISYNDIPITESLEFKQLPMDLCIIQKFKDSLSSSKRLPSKDRYSEDTQLPLETINEVQEEAVKKEIPIEYSAVFTPIKHQLKKFEFDINEGEQKYLCSTNLNSSKSSGKSKDKEEYYSNSKANSRYEGCIENTSEVFWHNIKEDQRKRK